jgi:alkylated DNA nucleotide flippase Atl1
MAPTATSHIAKSTGRGSKLDYHRTVNIQGEVSTVELDHERGEASSRERPKSRR